MSRISWTLSTIASLYLLTTSPASALTLDSIPNPRHVGSWVSDTASIIPGEQESQINQIIDNIHNLPEAPEIAVVTVKSLDGQNVRDFGLQLAKRWGVGSADFNNGMLITVSASDRKFGVETGYGLEQVLPSNIAKRIFDENALPSFRKGDYGMGLINAVQAYSNKIVENHYLGLSGATSLVSTQNQSDSFAVSTIVILLVVLGLIAVWAWFFSRRKNQDDLTAKNQNYEDAMQEYKEAVLKTYTATPGYSQTIGESKAASTPSKADRKKSTPKNTSSKPRKSKSYSSGADYSSTIDYSSDYSSSSSSSSDFGGGDFGGGGCDGGW
jgi:uncharacterized protein